MARPFAVVRIPLACALILAAPVARAQVPLVDRVVLPPGYDASRAWPVVVFLPATDGTTRDMLAIYAAMAGGGQYFGAPASEQFAALLQRLVPSTTRAPDDGFVLILPEGRGSAADYATGEAWSRTILRYDSAVIADVRGAAALVRLDTARVFLAGFSMGGDLSWALINRNPMMFAGAVVMGSRAGYRGRATAMRDLARRGTRVAFTMGADEQAVRLTGARAADQALAAAGVPHRLETFPNASHEPAPLAVFADVFAWVQGRELNAEDRAAAAEAPSRPDDGMVIMEMNPLSTPPTGPAVTDPRSISAGPIAFGATVTGTLAPDGPQFNGKLLAVRELACAAGQTIAMDVLSDWDNYAVVLDPSGAPVAEDDDSGEGFNASLRFTCRATGPHWLIVTTYGSTRDAGLYTLRLAPADGARPGGAAKPGS